MTWLAHRPNRHESLALAWHVGMALDLIVLAAFSVVGLVYHVRSRDWINMARHPKAELLDYPTYRTLVQKRSN